MTLNGYDPNDKSQFAKRYYELSGKFIETIAMRELDQRIVLGTNDEVVLWWKPKDNSTWLQIVHSASPDEPCLFRIQPGLEREAFEHPYTMAWLHESELVGV